MRILISIAAALAIMAGLVMGLVIAGAILTKGAQTAVAAMPTTHGTLSKVAYAVLFFLVAGVSAGLVGGG